MNRNFLDLIKDLYGKTKYAIKVNNRITNIFNYSRGVKQGCPVSPILFNLYINDIFRTIDKQSDVILSEKQKINALMYADDLAPSFKTKRRPSKNKLAAYKFIV